jgi:lipopolysaccharide/colanic/teichoic acid biosynthesis glycosyltransferase
LAGADRGERLGFRRRRRRRRAEPCDGEYLEDLAYRPSGRLNRALNFILALVAAIALLPVMLLICLLVRLTSPGPILYTQVRVGLDRREPLDLTRNHRRERNLGGQPFTL